MLTEMRKVYILAFVIAQVLVFGDANGFRELPATPPVPSAAATKTIANTQAASDTRTSKLVPPVAAAATTTMSSTITTLASSNAPATITNYMGGMSSHAHRSKLKQYQKPPVFTPTQTTRKRLQLSTIQPKIMSGAMAMASAAAATMTKNVGNVEKAETGANFENKSRANMSVVTSLNAGGSNETKTQIKNANEYRTWMNTNTTNNEFNSLSGTKNGQGVLKPANEQEDSATTVGVNLLQAGRPGSAEIQSVTEAATPSTTEHVEGQVKNGLYRIKLAEIITDAFSGPLQSEVSAALAKTETGVITPAANNTMQSTMTGAPQKKQQQHIVENSKLPYNVGIVDNASNDETTAYKVHNNGSYNHNNNSNDKRNYHKAMTGKLKIADLYPVPLENFIQILRDSNAKLLRERTIFTHSDAEAKEHHQNLLPNGVEAMQPEEQAAFAQIINTANKKGYSIPTPSLVSDTVAQSDSISDFTGKLLAEQDGVITEIEQKFRLSEFAATESSKITTTGAKSFLPTATASHRPGEGKFSYSVNHKILLPSGHEFIDRRVKKSFDFPMHRTSSDVMAMPHIDFANTKFNTDTTGGERQAAQSVKLVGESAGTNGRTTISSSKGAGHPEFSTTKFYNSKELYNELMQHNRQKFKVKIATTTAAAVVAFEGQSAASRFAGLPSLKLKTVTKSTHEFVDSSNPITSTSHWNHDVRNTTSTFTTARPTVMRVALTPTLPRKLTATEAEKVPTTTPISIPALHSKKFQKELKRSKLLLKTIMLPSGSNAAAITTEAISDSTTAPTAPANGTAVNTQTAVTSTNSSTPMLLTGKSGGNGAATSTSPKSTVVATAGASPTSSSAMPLTTSSAPSLQMAVTTIDTTMTTKTRETTPVQQHTTNSTRSTSKPIVRPRILSRLQEKVNSLECEIQNVPQDSHLWRGNETHELLLPIMTSEFCPPSGVDCAPLLISWEGEADIQSGDILIVEINDALLNPNDRNNTKSAHTTQVYQVTRSGHEHCDVTEGILLDITPLVVDGRKLVTLYDKDLTEGVNLLIVVSELWGSQCVRLKVTTKTDNCGENAECSNKGVCYSNAAMEEYECQCCSGFAGPHCEEIDACTPSPCTNNGICVDLSQGHEGNSYQCLCPYGYTGINCQYESDPCNSADCMNGGSCVGNSTHFRCDCMPGFTGPLCQHSLNECESSPCVHGICVDQEDGFRCFCQPGFAGELCNFEYNECESNPCQNDGECIDHIGNYECRCTKGYMGARCQIKVDFCTNKPCPDGHRCIDHGNDFSCECPGGRNGPECNQMPRTQCNVNPCTHGGTCWSSGDSFYCACRPGYTGTMCEDEFVVETVVSSSEFMVDDTSTRNFNDKTFGSSVVLKSPIELHNAYFAAGVLAAAIFIVAIVVTICHCKVNQTYRKFSTRSYTFFPILGFGRRHTSQGKLNKHWLSGKGLGSGNSLRSSPSSASLTRHNHLPSSHGGSGDAASLHAQHQQGGQLHERPFQRHLAMNLENDMYYTVDFSEHSQRSPLIQ